MQKKPTKAIDFWNELEADSQHAFILHAWRVRADRDFDRSYDDQSSTPHYMDEIKKYCDITLGDTTMHAVIHAADTLKNVQSHVGTAFDSLPESVRRANAIYHVANEKAEPYLIPVDVFHQTQGYGEGRSFLDRLHDDFKKFQTTHAPETGNNVINADVSQAVDQLLSSVIEIKKMAQGDMDGIALEKLDRRAIARHCKTIQTAEIAKQHPELQVSVKAFLDMVKDTQLPGENPAPQRDSFGR